MEQDKPESKKKIRKEEGESRERVLNTIVFGKRKMSDIVEDDKRSEASPKPSQLTPFSIADILSRRTSCAERRASESEETQGAPSFARKTHQVREYDCTSDNIEHRGSQEDRNQMARFSRLPSPDLSVARELDILTRNLVHANISNFGTIPQLAQGTFKHLENLGNMGGYQPVKDSREALQRQQDEALDMSKNKYLGELSFIKKTFVPWTLLSKEKKEKGSSVRLSIR